MKRSKWKGLYVNLKLKKFNDLKKTKNPQPTLIIPRNFSIIPKFIGLTFTVYNGKSLKKILIKEEMIGHKFGEFAKTRSEFVFKKKKRKKKHNLI
jgi:small subunit ribosomal protein S19